MKRSRQLSTTEPTVFKFFSNFPKTEVSFPSLSASCQKLNQPFSQVSNNFPKSLSSFRNFFKSSCLIRRDETSVTVGCVCLSQPHRQKNNFATIQRKDDSKTDQYGGYVYYELALLQDVITSQLLLLEEFSGLDCRSSFAFMPQVNPLLLFAANGLIQHQLVQTVTCLHN